MYRRKSGISESGRLFTAESISGGFEGVRYVYTDVRNSDNLPEGVIKPEFSLSCIWKCGKKLWDCKEECITDFNGSECIACLGPAWNTCKSCF